MCSVCTANYMGTGSFFTLTPASHTTIITVTDCDDDIQPQTKWHEGALRLIAQCDLSVDLGVINPHLLPLRLIPQCD